MSVLRPRPPADPIVFVDPTGDVSPEDGAIDCRALAAVIEQPARLLADYRMERPASELYAILQAARRIRDRNDRVVVTAAAAETAAARAILETCCHPVHDQLPRTDRGGRPRLSFTGARFANDFAQGLLDLVAPDGRPPGVDLLDRWALVIVAGDDRLPLPVAATARLFLHAMTGQGGCEPADVVDRVATVGATLAPLAAALGGAAPFSMPAGCDGGAVFTAAALLPAAIAGVDVVRLLEGAVAMNMRLAEAPFDDNPVRRFLAGRPFGTRELPCRHRLATEDERLAAIATWFDLVQDATGVACEPVTSSRLVGGEPRCDPLIVPPPAAWTPDGDGLPLDDVVGLSWRTLAERDTGHHTAPEIRLPRVDEHAIGQLLQMLLLVTRAGPGAARDTGHAPDAAGRSPDGPL